MQQIHTNDKNAKYVKLSVDYAINMHEIWKKHKICTKYVINLKRYVIWFWSAKNAISVYKPTSGTCATTISQFVYDIS